MSNLREQMQALAEKITRERQARSSRLVKNRRETQRLRKLAQSELSNMKESTAALAKQTAQQLAEFKQQNSQTVARNLKSLQNTRQIKATYQKSVMQQETVKIRRFVARALRQNQHDRIRSSQLRRRSAAETLHEVRLRVQVLRYQSQRFIKSIADDLSTGRQVWLKILSSPTTSELGSKTTPSSAKQADQNNLMPL